MDRELGSFEIVLFKCFVCGKQLGVFSSVREGAGNFFTLENAPDVVKADIIGKSCTCDSCGATVQIGGIVALSMEWTENKGDMR